MQAGIFLIEYVEPAKTHVDVTLLDLENDFRIDQEFTDDQVESMRIEEGRYMLYLESESFIIQGTEDSEEAINRAFDKYNSIMNR